MSYTSHALAFAAGAVAGVTLVRQVHFVRVHPPKGNGPGVDLGKFR